MASFKKNFMYQAIYQLVTILSPLIITPHISRALGPTNIGIYSYAYSIAYYFLMFANLGVQVHGSRCIAQVKNDKEKLNKTFTNLFYAHFFVALFVSIAYLTFVLLFIEENKSIHLLMTFYVASSIFDVKWFFYGLEDFKVTVLRNIIVKVLTIFAILFFIRTGQDLKIYTFINAFGLYFLSEFILFTLFHKRVKLLKIQAQDVIRTISPLLMMFASVAAMSICRHINKVMLGSMSTMEQTGYFENVDKIYLLLILFTTTLSDVALPRVSNLISNNQFNEADSIIDKSIQICIFSSVAFCFGIIAIAPDFIPAFLGADFTESTILLILIAPTIIFLSFSATIRKLVLLPNDMNKEYLTIMITGAIMNIVLNFIFIPMYDAKGAVFSTIITEFYIMAVQFVKIRHLVNLKKYINPFLFHLSVGAIMLIAIRFFVSFTSYSIVNLGLQILIGAAIYLGGTFIYHKSTNSSLYSVMVGMLRSKRKY